MAALQEEVRRLQHEISELGGSEETRFDSAGREVDSDQMAVLHRQLKQKQAELAKYQARV